MDDFDLTPIWGAVSTTVVGIIGVLGAFVIAMLPRVWIWMGSKVYGTDMLLLNTAVDNAAEQAVTAEGRIVELTIEAAVDWMVAYVSLKDAPKVYNKLVAKGEIDEAWLRSRCDSAFMRVLRERRKVGMR